MAGRYAADAAVAAQEALIAETTAAGARLSAEGKASGADATERLDAATRGRAALAAKIPTDLLGLYERLAARGPGAGLLQHRTCGGCRMVLAGTDLQKIALAAEDDVVHCPECGCILVRTYESGL